MAGGYFNGDGMGPLGKSPPVFPGWLLLFQRGLCRTGQFSVLPDKKRLHGVLATPCQRYFHIAQIYGSGYRLIPELNPGLQYPKTGSTKGFYLKKNTKCVNYSNLWSDWKRDWDIQGGLVFLSGSPNQSITRSPRFSHRFLVRSSLPHLHSSRSV